MHCAFIDEACAFARAFSAYNPPMSFRNHFHPPRVVLTASGQRLQLRDIRPRDAAALMRGFSRLSPEEIRMRFLYPMKMLTIELAERLTRLHRQREIALVLTNSKPAGEAPIYAVVRASRQPYSKIAEFAIVVPRALSGQGIGRVLMQELILRCELAGVDELVGDVLVDNHAMLHLARALGFGVRHHPQTGGQLQLHLKLSQATAQRI
jgi:acetyltransferase